MGYRRNILTFFYNDISSYVKNNEKNIDIIICTKFFNRFMGFMGKKNSTYALVFPKCNSIHTMFMKFNIDVYLCDKNFNILFIYKNMPKNKFILPKKGIYYTFEFPTGLTSFNIHDRIDIIEHKI